MIKRLRDIDTLNFFCYNFNMEQGIEILDLLFQGLKFKDAVYTEKNNVCVINFLYNPENFTPNDENKSIIMAKCKDLIGDFVKFELSFKSCPLDKRAIANHTYTTIVNNFPSLSKNFTFDDVQVEIENLKVTIKLKLSPTSYEHAKNLNRSTIIEEKLKDSFFADFEVAFEKKEDVIESTNQIEKNMELMASIKEAEEKTVYELSNIADIIGKNEYSLAIDFTKVNSVVENVIICGDVTSVQKKTYKRKVTKNKEESEIERTFYNFTIKNENKILYCSIFPKQHDEIKGDLIEVGMKVCCFGSFREFNGKLNFTANSIARCDYKREEIKSGLKSVNENYHTVFPNKYIDYEQAGLFDDNKTFPGTYVVFDLETTGLDATKEEIIEIGACKVVDGRIDETFATFVKPSKHIPKEITELTGINDEMVKDAPTINYVMPDFYKFCDEATLVCQNVAFDTSFIHNISKKLSYNFNHPTMDTMIMARQKLPGLKNYKLGTIVDKLNISLENAHRAIDDATATAKAFIKLMNMN